ncbi:unnamed protein product [Candida verbasci]|uniref:Cleavage/polyadenylation specificity factor A subunit N-terminal domain-containing protein n=1 Tax=Candida verbasci TaxID=1227364 RepID=A0A9W4TUG2_9ASCO|nr:unnamed protein product [Candida verbasci]
MDLDFTDDVLQNITIAPKIDKSNLYLNDKFAKQTLIPSPIVNQIIPKFKVKINKKFQGSSSVLFNDEEYQMLLPKEEDSQMDVFSDIEEHEDFLLNSNENEQNEQPSKSESLNIEKSKFEHIQVLVKYQSLLIDGIEFKFRSAIRSSCVIKASSIQEEDHLLISLKSGYLILVKLFYIPRGISDIDYKYQTQVIDDKGNSIFRPFIVQWWDVSGTSKAPTLNSSGYQLKSSPSGRSTVSCPSSDSFRLFMTLPQASGTILRNHFNIKVEGLLLDSCFIIPNNSQQQTDIFLTLNFTDNRRLDINLFSWSTQQSDGIFPTGFSKSILPLDNQFEIPVFIIPLQHNQSFLFVSTTKITIISIHDIVSAEYNFNFQDVPWGTSFPTTFYVPNEPLYDIEYGVDQILIATDNGVIYSFIIKGTSFTSKAIFKIQEPISQFTVEKCLNGYDFTYSHMNGSSKRLLINDILKDESVVETKNGFSEANLVTNFKNWTPLIDFTTVENLKCAKQELWGISGIGKNSKLNHFRYGYVGTRKSFIYEKLRKTLKLWKLSVNDSVYLLCSLPFENILLEFQRNSKQDVFVEIKNPLINSDEITIHAGVINDIVVQVTNKSIVLSDLLNETLTNSMDNKIILHAEIHQQNLFLVVQSSNSIYLQVYEVLDLLLSTESNPDDYFNFLCGIELFYQPSMMKLFENDSESGLSIGSYDGFIYFYEMSSTIKLIQSLNLSQIYLNPNDITELPNLIPNDMIVHKSEFLFGTKEGYLVTVEYLDEFKFKSCKKLGNNEVSLLRSASDPQFLFIQCKEIWLVNGYESTYPVRIYFDDIYDRQIHTFVELELYSSKFQQLAIIRDNGLVLTHISTFQDQAIKQVSIFETGSKLLYLPYISAFLILTKSKSNKNRIKCVDKKSLKIMIHKELKFKSRSNNADELLFDTNEYPINCCVWEINRGQKVSKKVLIGCRKASSNGEHGTVKVLDFKKVKSENETNIAITELNSFDHENPITNINQIAEVILYTSESQLYYNSYNELEKRFTPIKLLKTLPSKIISMNISNDDIILCTQSDSIFHFELPKLFNSLTSSIDLKACDPFANTFVNSIPFGALYIAGNKTITNVDFYTQLNSTLKRSHSSKVNTISRVASINLNDKVIKRGIGVDKNCILGVGFGGEITCLKPLTKDENDKFSQFQDRIKKSYNPFINKISGTGLFSLNKPVLDYNENKANEQVIDFDLQESSEMENLYL